MTDYGELMARAVAALDKSTGASRRALYGRMRTALVEALRKVDPPLSESEITRERLSLENVIRKVEAEAVHRAWVEASGASTLAKVEASERPASDQESDADRSIASGLEPASDVPLPNSEPVPEEKPDAMSVVEDEAHSPVLVRDRSQEWEAVPPMADAARQPFADPEGVGVKPEATRDEISNADAGAESVAHMRSRTQQLEPVPLRAHTARGLLAGAASNVPDLDRFRLSLETAFRTAEADPADSRLEGKRDGKPAADSEVPRARLDRNREREAVPEGPRTARQSNGGAAASIPDLDDFILSVERALRNAQATAAGSRAEAKRDSKRADPSGAPLPGRVDATGARLKARPEETGETVSPRPAQSRQLFARAAARAVDLGRFERPLESRELTRRSESLPGMSESEPRIAPRPAAPQPPAAQQRPPAAVAVAPPRRSKRALISAFLGVFMVIALALAAYWLQAPLKAVLMRNPALQLGLRSTLSPPKIADRLGQAGQQGSAAGPAGASQETALAAVAQRAVLFDEGPSDAQGKRYTGSVIWRTETVSPGARQTPELAVKGTVEIPERHIKMTVSIRRNTDKELPASHVVEVMFNLPADFPSGGISDLPSIRMKQAEDEPGAPLAGATAKVTSEYYLTGLSASDADMQRNLELLKNRAWFSIWIVYNNRRHAILTIEKGAPGDSAFKEAFAAWAG